MANVDRPNGFQLVRTFSGAPVSSLVRTIGVTDAVDLFVGDIVNLESGLAAIGATNDAAFLGVVIGFGKVDGEGVPLGPYNPDALTTTYYDDSASTHTEWVAYYIPVQDAIFEAQTATALTLAVGDTCDLLATAGDTASGRSRQEITTNTNADFTVIEIPKIVGNDPTLIYGRYYVAVTRAEQAYHA